MDEIIDELWSQQKLYKSAFEAYHHLIYDHQKVTLHIEQYQVNTNALQIRRAGDFLIGFMSPTSTVINVMVGPIAQWRLELPPDVLVKGLNGIDYIPCNNKADIHIKLIERPYFGLMPTINVLWAFINPKFNHNKHLLNANIPYPNDDTQVYELACYSGDKMIFLHTHGGIRRRTST